MDNKHLVKKYTKELSKKVGRSEEDLIQDGLLCTDFKYIVELKGDDLNLEFHNALCVTSGSVCAVFTEHCGYYGFDRNCLYNYFD